MNNKKNIILSFAFVLILALSLLIFLGNGEYPKSSISICSFIFIVITEIIVFANALLLTNNKNCNTFMKAGFSSSVCIYTIASLFINILFTFIIKTLRTCLVTNFSLLIIYLFVDTIIILFKKGE